MTDTTHTLDNTPLLSNKTYDFLVKLVQLVLPAAATLYFTLANIFDLPSAEQVVAAAAAFATFFGVLLRLSNRSYEASGAKYDGAVNVVTDEVGGKVFSLELAGDPSDIEFMDEVVFKVQH
jgi:hypothetical protein